MVPEIFGCGVVEGDDNVDLPIVVGSSVVFEKKLDARPRVETVDSHVEKALVEVIVKMISDRN